MNSLAIFFFALVAYVNAAPLEVHRYPANMDPALCPDYPICDNSLLFGTPPILPMPSLEAPAPILVPEMPITFPETRAPVSLTDGRYPPGVHPSACPNYPFCNVSQIVLPLPGFATRLYPPGVHPSACPNYPIC